ncbi:MAG TPA: hypothetical protein DCG57_06205, partial [Candidatus Riflebacteria bacterium]|nr:hypothetical protein [Candidatus Riflebacteria bacterium]
TTAWSEEVIRFYPFEASTADAQTYKDEKIVRARWPIYENEIVKTFVGLSKTPGGDDIVGFTDVGHATEYTFSGVTLQTGQTYYVTVMVQDAEGYLNGYGTSVCSSRGFIFDYERDLVDVASSTYFNNALARVMSEINANSVTSLPFGNNVIRRYRAPITLIERGIESRFNAPVEITLGGTGFPGTLLAAQQQLRIADEWGNEVPCMVTANGPTPVEEFLFDNGTENVSFVNGFTSGTGTGEVTELAASTRIRAVTTNGTERAWVTDLPVDLTGWDEVVINWSNTGQNNNNNLSRCIVSTNRNGGYATNIAASNNRTNSFAQRTDSINVSGLNGNHYIRVHARRNGNNGDSTVNVFSILLRKTVNQCTATIIANVPRGASRTYWAYWGAGGNPLPTTGFINSTNDTSQRAWSRFYSRKLLPPGIEEADSWTRLSVTSGDWYDQGGTWVTLPWSFPYFDLALTTRFVMIKGILTGVTQTSFVTYTNTWNLFTQNAANRTMIAPLWQDTSVRETDPQPQNIGFFTVQKDLGQPDARQGFYWRANRFGLLDNIYMFQTFLYQFGDIAHRYEYLSYGGLWAKEFYDNPVNVAPHFTVGISRNNNVDYFWSTPLREGIGKTPTSFFQYKNAVTSVQGPVEDAVTLAGAGYGFAGHFDSHVFDSRITTPEWQRIFYEMSGTGRVHLYVRTGATSEPDASWSVWTLAAGNVAGNGNQALTAGKQRFIQYRCEFIKNNAGNTPTLNRVEFQCRGFEITRITANTPDGVTQGQENIGVAVTVKNYDPASSVEVATLTPLFSLGSYTFSLASPAVMPYSIPPGGEADFVFMVNVNDESPIGTSTVDAIATATIGAQTFVDNGADIVHEWEVKRKAELFIEHIDATPLTVNKGQTVRVRMVLSNPGGTPFIFDAATLTFSLGSYDDTPPTLDLPPPGTIVNPGETITATFTVTVDIDSPSGVAILDGTAIGRNSLSNKIASDTAALITDSWTIQNPASLVIESVLASATVYRGQTGIPVFVNVLNLGEALAYWDSSEVLLSFGSYDLIEAQTLFPIDVYGGLYEMGEYWVNVAADSATGTSDVDASIKYRDANTGDDYEEIGALLPASWTIIGEKVMVYKDPALLFESTSFNRPTAGVVDIFARAEDLAPLKEYVVRWYRPDGTEYDLTSPPKTSDASGTVSHQIEIDSSAPYGAWTIKITNPLNTHIACQNVFQVVSPADPSLIISLPAKVSVGQTFTASATMVNNGGAIFKTAYLGSLVKGGAGGDANFLGGPVPGMQDVADYSAATFSYQLQATNQGTFTLQGAGYGYDGNSDEFITVASHTSDICLIQSPPVLSVVQIIEAYTTVYCNQQNLSVTMRIRNTGQADAIIEAASLTFTLGNHVQVINAPATFPFILGAGVTSDIFFTVGVNADSPAGAVTVGGSFFAHDANNPSSTFAVIGGAGAWTISAIAGICSANSTYNPEQYAFNVGQTVYARFINLPPNTDYRIRFYNNSPAGGTLLKTSPVLNSGPFGRCDDTWNLIAGSSLTRWRVIIDTGTYAVPGAVLGVQYFDVQNPGNLQTGLNLSPSEVFVGETFSATLVATNTVVSGSTIASAVPAILTKTLASTGDAAKLSGPTPETTSVLPQVPGVYSWEFEATADTTTVGSFSLTADSPNSVAGYDMNTGAEVLSNKSVSNSISIYRRALDIGSTTLDFGTLLPGDDSEVLYFSVINSGNYNLNNVKWTAADLRNEEAKYISKAYLSFLPADFAISPAPANIEIASALLKVPYNQASGSYIATMSVYEDLNGNNNRDFVEPLQLFSVKVVVPQAKKIIVTDTFIDLDNWSPGQITNSKAVNYFNGGNLDLVNLKVIQNPVGIATFVTATPSNPGAMLVAVAGQLQVVADIPLDTAPGQYIATFTIFDDQDDDGFNPTDASATFVVTVGVGNKSFTITPATLNAGNATPTFVIEDLPFSINNTGFLGLTALRALPGELTSGGNLIPSDSIALFLPASVPSGPVPGDATLNLYVPAGTPQGLYSGVLWVFEDNNNNLIYDNGEASASFIFTTNVPAYPAVQVIPSTVDLGDVAAGTGISTTFLCRNIGNVTLNKLHWEKIPMISGANNIPAAAYSFPGGEPFSVPSGALFTRQITLNVPALQADGNYVGHMSWLFEDNILVDGFRKTTVPVEPQSGFRVACRVGDLSLDVVEAAISTSGGPASLSAWAGFSVFNDGTLTVSNPKATASVLIGPGTIPASANLFSPVSIGYIVAGQTKSANWRVLVPPGTPSGDYTGTLTVWNDSNSDGIINPGEAVDTAALTLTVLAKRVIEVVPKPLLLPLSTDNNMVSGDFSIINRGNIVLNDLAALAADLTTLTFETIPAASISFIIPGGPLALGASITATVIVSLGPQIPGNYRGNMRIYDDFLPPVGYSTEESDVFELRLTVGKKSFTVTSPVNFPNAQPGDAANNNPVTVVTNTSALALSRLRWKAGNLIFGANIIASESVLFPVQPAAVGVGGNANYAVRINVLPYLPSTHVPPGTYVGTHTVWEDDNNDGIMHPTNEASGTFVTYLTVLPVSVLNIETDPISFGDVAQGGNSAMIPVTVTNTGNVDLSTFVWLFTSLYMGADSIDGSVKLKSDPLPASLAPSESAVLNVWLEDVSGTQPVGFYESDLGNRTRMVASGLAQDNVMINCTVIPGGPPVPQVATPSVYQEVDKDIFVTQTSPQTDLYFLSAWVCPGNGSADIAFLQFDASNMPVATISLRIDASGNVTVNDPHPDFKIVFSGVSDSVPFGAYRYYRVYVAFRLVFGIPDIGADSLKIILHNSSNTPGESVWFDGIKLERAMEGQTLPTAFHPRATLRSPSLLPDISGDRRFYEK